MLNTTNEAKAAVARQERRREIRKRTIKKAVIAFNSRYCALECVVRNQTDGGAMLMLSQNHMVPRVIEYRLSDEGRFRLAEVVWRSDKAMGIKFTSTPQQKPVPALELSNGDVQELRSPRSFGRKETH